MREDLNIVLVERIEDALEEALCSEKRELDLPTVANA